MPYADHKDLEPYDQFITHDGYICVVLCCLGTETYLAHPKYIVDVSRCSEITDSCIQYIIGRRISNPFSPSRTNGIVSSKYLIPVGDYDYIVRKTSIQYEFRATVALKRIIDMPVSGNPIISIARELSIQLSRFLPLSELGFTGSIALDTAKIGSSDIDLVVSQSVYSQYYKIINRNTIDGLVRRTINEWKTFYEQYDVISGLEPCEFASHMIRKPHQFMYNNIPVSTFIKDNTEIMIKLFACNLSLQFKTNMSLKGTVLLCRDWSTPSLYVIFDPYRNVAVPVFSFNRAYESQLVPGEQCEIVGLANEKQTMMLIRANSNNYIRKI